MALDYTDVVNNRAAIAAKITAIKTRLTASKNEFSKASLNLAAMATDYAETIQAAADGLAADPGNVAWGSEDAALALHTADFIALKAEVDAAVAE